MANGECGRSTGHWIPTDHLAVVQKDGGIQIIGRREDIIVQNGAKMYPHKYEIILRRMVQIKEASVFGVPNRKLGQDPVRDIS